MKSKRWVSSFKRLAERFQMDRDDILDWMKDGMPVQRTKRGQVRIDTDAVKLWAREKKKVEVKDPPENRNAVIQSLVESGLPKVEVARMFNIGSRQVYNVLNQQEADQPFIDKFKANRANILALNQLKRQKLQDQILDAIKDQDIVDEPLKGKIVAVNLLGQDKHREFDMERLERGESTENVAVIVQAIRDAKRRKEEQEGVEGDE